MQETPLLPRLQLPMAPRRYRMEHIAALSEGNTCRCFFIIMRASCLVGVLGHSTTAWSAISEANLLVLLLDAISGVVVALQIDRVHGFADLLDRILLGCVELRGELGEKHRIE